MNVYDGLLHNRFEVGKVNKADESTTGFKEIMYKTPRPTVDFK